MLDPKLVRVDPERVRKAIADKGERADLDLILALDEKRRGLLVEVEQKKADRNRASEEIARLKKAGQDAASILASMKSVSDEIKSLDEQLRTLEQELDAQMLWLPNMPHETVPVGPDASANVEVRRWGDDSPRAFRPARTGRSARNSGSSIYSALARSRAAGSSASPVRGRCSSGP